MKKTYKIVQREKISTRQVAGSQTLHTGLSIAQAQSILLEYYNSHCHTSFSCWPDAEKQDDMEKIFRTGDMYGFIHGPLACYIKEEQ